jgi:hypothetical protein
MDARERRMGAGERRMGAGERYIRQDRRRRQLSRCYDGPAPGCCQL